MQIIKLIIMLFVGIVVAASIIYGSYWAAKTFSYSFFYEDMVVRTITKTVKPEALK
mgnify:CR=1 FL=1